MATSIKLFVVDTGPLITLAAADTLDYLLLVDAEIIIPDAVLYEAMHDAAKLGAQDILDWVTLNRARIELAPTKAYVIFEAARTNLPHLREAGLGERAAVEVIETPDRLSGEERAILLCEESSVLRRVVVRDRERIVEVSTMDFLRILEAEQKIQSSERVFELAAQAGRNASLVEKMPGQSEEIKRAVREVLRGARRSGDLKTES